MFERNTDARSTKTKIRALPSSVPKGKVKFKLHLTLLDTEPNMLAYMPDIYYMYATIYAWIYASIYV